MLEIKEFTDEEKKQILQKYTRMSYANLKKSIIQDLIKNMNESAIYKRYKKEDVVNMLENPQKNEAKIRELSNYVYDISSHYKRLIDYFSSILFYNYNIVPLKLPEKINAKKFKEEYIHIANECDKYNFKHEGTKCIKVVLREGVYFGLTYETNDSFYIKQVNPKYAQITSIEDGTYTFEFDLNYFNGKRDLLLVYGTDFVNAYDRYKGNEEKGIKPDKTKRWYEPKNCVVFKADESDPYYSLPYFTGLLLDVFSIDDYKMLQKAKKENDNYKAIGLEIPTDEDGVPLLDYEQNEEYFNHIVDNIDNDGVGVFMSPFKMQDFSFASTRTAEVNDVVDAEEQFWMASGVSSLIFGSVKATSSSSLILSVKPDEQLAFSILLQFQRYFNKKIKKMNLNYGFKIEFTSQSIFNNNEYVDRYAKAGQYGLPVKMAYASSLGLSPSDVIGLTYLEEDILNLSIDSWTNPLISSNVQSGDGGRPTAEESGTHIGDAGEQTRENDSNANR